MRLWRFARSFRAEGHDIRVVTDIGLQSMETHVEVNGARVGTDRLVMSAEAYRNTRISVPLGG